jgi:demethylmenaquinone methyltransferase/2-methoxy-6-polyprenyl-1,4-benzoquinol methylase
MTIKSWWPENSSKSGKKMKTEKNKTAIKLFAPIAHDYGIWSRILSFGQDPRWRCAMVKKLDLFSGARVLDVAAGTGEVTRLLQRQGYEVFSLDLSPEMLGRAAEQGAVAALARAEELPFPDQTFEAVTFTYLLRYVEDPQKCMRELSRVIRPGGRAGMVEFGRPRKLWGALWYFYTRNYLPLAGKLAGNGWQQVGSFLGPSIDEFWRFYDFRTLSEVWEKAGFENIETKSMSLGGGFLITGTKK